MDRDTLAQRAVTTAFKWEHFKDTIHSTRCDGGSNNGTESTRLWRNEGGQTAWPLHQLPVHVMESVRLHFLACDAHQSGDCVLFIWFVCIRAARVGEREERKCSEEREERRELAGGRKLVEVSWWE